MKLYAMSDLLQSVDSRYLLVNAVAHRAREIAVQAEVDHVSLEEKPVTMAMDEAAEGHLVIASQQVPEETVEAEPEEVVEPVEPEETMEPEEIMEPEEPEEETDEACD